MAGVKPYSLQEAQQLIDVALVDARNRHSEWQLLEHLYAAGSTDPLVANATAPGDMARIIQETTGVPLDTVNMVLPHINIILAAIVYRDPRLLCEPVSGGMEAEDYATVAEAVLRYFWNRTHATRDLYDATKDMVVIGNGFLKVGWTYQEEERERSGEDRDREIALAVEFDNQLSLEDGSPFSAFDELEAAVPETEIAVVLDEPYVEYVSPYDIFVPVDARRVWESRWVAQRIIKPVDEIRAEYNLSEKFPLQTIDGSRRDVVARDRDQRERDPFLYAEVFEFYDLRTRKLMVFQRVGDEPLASGDWPWTHRYPPFVHLANYRRNPSEFWAFGDLKNIAGLQAMLNDTVREQMENMRRSGNKVLIDERLVTPEVEDGLTSPENNLAVKVRLPDGTPMNQMVMPLPSQPLPNDVYAAYGTLQQSMAEVLGLSDFQRGQSGADRMSGTAAAAVEGASTARAMDKVQAVELAAAEVGTLILLLAQEFMSEGTAIRVAGSRGVVWETVSPELIKGEFKVSVEGGSMRAINPATRQQRALERANVLVPLLANSGYEVDALMRGIVRDLGEDPDIVLVRPEPEPMPEPMPAAGPEPALMDPMAGLPVGEPIPDLGPQSLVGGAVENQLDGGVAL